MSNNNNKIQVVIDATELDNFEMCHFRWHMFHHEHIRPKKTESHFEKGTLLHYFMEHYYRTKRDKGEITQESLESIIEAGRIKSLEFNINLEELSETIFQVREYARYYGEENIIPVYIEELFMVKIYEDEQLEVYLSGKPDLIFRYSNSSDLIVLDHKRMSRNTDYSQLRNQFQLYATAMKTDTVVVNKIGFQKTLKPKDRFLRQVFVYNPEILAEWREDIIMKAKEMVIAHQTGYYPKNRTSCEKWSGCYLQRYCSTRPKAREFLIGTEYVVGKPWDVSSDL